MTSTITRTLLTFCVALLCAGCAGTRKAIQPAAGAPEIRFFLVDEDPASTAPTLPLQETGERLSLRDVSLEQADIASASVRESSGLPGTYEVRLGFTPQGTKRLAELTAANVRRRLAIVVDGRILSAPTIMEPIKGGGAVITYQFTRQQAQDLADRISRKVGKRMEAIVRDIMALKARFPQLANIGDAHWRDGSLTYSHGLLEVPNPDYERQLAEYPREKARREAEVARGIIRKYPRLVEPSRTLTRLDARTGVRLTIRFTGEDPTTPEEIYQVGIAPMPMPEYDDLSLVRFHNPEPHYRGRIQDQHFQMWIEAGSREETERLRDAILEVFRHHQRRR